jgi:trehalose/maltose hydrolase-like predicted phosphorylase
VLVPYTCPSSSSSSYYKPLNLDTGGPDQAYASVIRGDNVDLQRRIRASLFHILTNLLPGDRDKSITVSGLSSDPHAGLVFWDAETWIYPSILALFPDYARGINNYRSNRLD